MSNAAQAEPVLLLDSSGADALDDCMVPDESPAADDGLVLGVAQALRSGLPHLAEPELRAQVRAALDEMAPIRVTAYLGVLVERRLRGDFPRQRA